MPEDPTEARGGLEKVKPEVYTDSAYHSQPIRTFLSNNVLNPKICSKRVSNKELSEEEKALNRENSKIRCRGEHIFGAMYQKANDQVMRGIGLVRAETRIGLRNLAYNMARYELELRG